MATRPTTKSRKATKATKATKAPKPVVKCACECGGTTKGGRFRPGHDAKLKGRLIAAVKDGDRTAATRLRSLGWEAHIPEVKPKAAKAAGKKAPAKRTRKAA